MASRYSWLTLVCACLVSWFYFGDIWRAPDSYLFTSSGDGLQGYYQTAWHVRYDSTDWKQQSLNYPFGESIFFTGGQPVLTNIARALGVNDGMIGVSNLFLLSSGILASLFVFLLLSRLGVSKPYAVFYSVALIMLSQQWERLSGHFALSVMCAVPLLLWMFLCYFEGWKEAARKNSYRTIGIAALLFFLGLIQLYYLFFAAVLFAAFALVYLLRKQITSKLTLLIQSAVMFTVPFIVLKFLMSFGSEVTDRTAIPWGFLIYRSSIGSYLYPLGMPYEYWVERLKPAGNLEWEGLAFVGFSMLLALLTAFIVRLKKWSWKPAADKQSIALQAFAFASVCCVLVSLAFPFNIGFESLLYKLGAIQQFRGIGRFAFVAYYPITIFAVVVLFRTLTNTKALHVAAIGIGLLLLVEGHARMSLVSSRISNPRHSSLTTELEYPFVEAGKYQAIHPIPYAHIGSENIGFTADDDAMRRLYDASYALAMPSTATVMSRTSLGQSFLSCAMEWEIMQTPEILGQFPDQRPLLAVVDREHIQERHRKLLMFSDSLYADGRFGFYSLPLSAFEKVRALNENQSREVLRKCVYGNEGRWSDDSLKQFVFVDSTRDIHFSHGWRKVLQQSCLTEWRGDTLAVSFWVKDFIRDLVPRTVVEFIQFDEAKKVVDYQTEFMGKRVIGMRGSDALVEYTLIIHPACTEISMAAENKLIQGCIAQINSLLLRPQSMNCRILRNENESLNNRYYSR
jgi:hypothetical protein